VCQRTVWCNLSASLTITAWRILRAACRADPQRIFRRVLHRPRVQIVSSTPNAGHSSKPRQMTVPAFFKILSWTQKCSVICRTYSPLYFCFYSLLHTSTPRGGDQAVNLLCFYFAQTYVGHFGVHIRRVGHFIITNTRLCHDASDRGSSALCLAGSLRSRKRDD
jgi:hypothetical protein